MPPPRPSGQALASGEPGSRPLALSPARAPLFKAAAGSPAALWPLGATFGHLAAASRNLASSAARERGPKPTPRCATSRRAHTRDSGQRAGGLRAGLWACAHPLSSRRPRSRSRTRRRQRCSEKRTKLSSARASASKKSCITCGGGGCSAGEKQELPPTYAKTSQKTC